MTTLPDESTIPRQEVPLDPAVAANLFGLATRPSSASKIATNTTITVVDNWMQRESEDLEAATFTPGGCSWSIRYRTGTAYAWGRGETRSMSKTHALWPAGAPMGNAATLPTNSPYPAKLETWLQCELDQPNADNFLAQFQMWIELQDAADSFAFRLYSGTCTATDKIFRGGLEWHGNAARSWADYHIYYPGFQSATNKACAEFKFTSGANGNITPSAQGPWLDDISFSSYQKPQSSVNCQNKDYTFHINNAPGTGMVSKGFVLPPYADDFAAGVVDDPNNDIDIAGMIGRMKAAGVQSVRLELMVHPSTFTNVNPNLAEPLNTVSPYQIDLRHYDRVIDMLCANQIGRLRTGRLSNVAASGLEDQYRQLPERLRLSHQTTGYLLQ